MVKVLIIENILLLFVSNQKAIKIQWTFLRKVLPQSNISTNEQLPATADSSLQWRKPAQAEDKGRSCSVQPGASLAPQPPGLALSGQDFSPECHTLLQPWWPPLVAAPVISAPGKWNAAHLAAANLQQTSAFGLPLPRWRKIPLPALGTACGRVSQWCNTFISLPLISNLSLSTLCFPPPPSITLDRETAANKEGICSCLLKDNFSFHFSFRCGAAGKWDRCHLFVFSDPRHAGEKGIASIHSCIHWTSGNTYWQYLQLHLFTHCLIHIISFSKSLNKNKKGK